MSKDKKNEPEAAGPEEKNRDAQAITAVRDLLFGETVADVTKQLEQAKSELQSEIDRLTAELKELREEQVASLNATLDEEREARRNGIASLKREIHSEIREIGKSTQKTADVLRDDKVSRVALADLLRSTAENLADPKAA